MPKVEYYPPPTSHLEVYSYQVCQALGEEYTHPEVVKSFALFLKVICTILAKKCNAEVVDNEAE